MKDLIAEQNVIDRVRDERTELQAKSAKLNAFMHSGPYGELSEGHKTMMREQIQVMNRYADILTVRLALFGINR